MSYAEVQDLSRRIASALKARGVRPGDRVAILPANEPTAFTCVFGIGRAGAVWCPINPRNEAGENRELLDLFGCVALIFQEPFAALVHQIRGDLRDLTTVTCFAHECLDDTDLSSLRCFWYGAAPISPARLEEAPHRIGPVMAQLFGQTEAPMMISTMAPREHFRPRRHGRHRAAGVGGPAHAAGHRGDHGHDGELKRRRETGEIVVRGSLVMRGHHRDPAATAAASAHGWHHTGDIGYLDDDNHLYIVDRAKDLPDDKWASGSPPWYSFVRDAR